MTAASSNATIHHLAGYSFALFHTASLRTALRRARDWSGGECKHDPHWPARCPNLARTLPSPRERLDEPTPHMRPCRFLRGSSSAKLVSQSFGTSCLAVYSALRGRCEFPTTRPFSNDFCRLVFLVCRHAAPPSSAGPCRSNRLNAFPRDTTMRAECTLMTIPRWARRAL
jgi:hypothetical protein